MSASHLGNAVATRHLERALHGLSALGVEHHITIGHHLLEAGGKALDDDHVLEVDLVIAGRAAQRVVKFFLDASRSAEHMFSLEEEPMSAHHPTVFPCLTYSDPAAAMTWLARAFGFEEHAVHRAPDGTIEHAEMTTGSERGTGMIMLGGDKLSGPFASPVAKRSLTYLVVSNIDAHHDRARAAGAEILSAPRDTDYGFRDYAARDPEGHVWSFGTYQPFAQRG